jgi:ADP-ribose pyrophosphatase
MRVVGSEVVFSGRVFNVRRDHLVFGNKTIVRDVVEHPGSVAFLPETEEGDVILVYQYRHPVGKRILEAPAGTLKKGESPLDCVKRELIEETGYEAGETEYLGAVYLAPGYSSEKIMLYRVKVSGYLGPRPEPGEDIITVKMPFRELLRRVLAGEVEDAETVILALLVAEKRGIIGVRL